MAKKVVFWIFHTILFSAAAVLAVVFVYKGNLSIGGKVLMGLALFAIFWTAFVAIPGSLFLDLHLKKYPINDYSEYRFSTHANKITNKAESAYIIEVAMENEIMTVVSGTQKLVFDVRGCVFPRQLVRAYFLRNIIADAFREKKCNRWRLFLPIVNLKGYTCYYNLKIRFHKCKRSKTYWLVRKGKSIANPIMGMAIASPYFQVIERRKLFQPKTIVKIKEADYVRNKNAH